MLVDRGDSERRASGPVTARDADADVVERQRDALACGERAFAAARSVRRRGVGR